MESLYRVVDRITYQTALKTGIVPRCNSDERSNLVHLNVKKDIELVANTYFQKSEYPLVLEVAPDSFVDSITWYEPSIEKPWREARVKINNIEIKDVIAIHELSTINLPKSVKFKLKRPI